MNPPGSTIKVINCPKAASNFSPGCSLFNLASIIDKLVAFLLSVLITVIFHFVFVLYEILSIPKTQKDVKYKDQVESCIGFRKSLSEELSIMATDIKRFFKMYEESVVNLDFEKTVEYFADTFILAGPKGVIAMNKTEFLKLSKQAVHLYKRLGRTSAKILFMKETPISNEYSMVKTHWGQTFRKTGDRTIESDITFLVQKTGSEPRIITFIDHQDDEKVYQELELLSS